MTINLDPKVIIKQGNKIYGYRCDKCKTWFKTLKTNLVGLGIDRMHHYCSKECKNK